MPRPEADRICAARQLPVDPLLAGLRVVILTPFDLDAYGRPTRAAGVSGFLL